LAAKTNPKNDYLRKYGSLRRSPRAAFYFLIFWASFPIHALKNKMAI
jgi:hypothetical protein